MPTFTSPDHFKEHKQYVTLLKKALLQVKPDIQKKFLYFKQYPFGAKKLPLVLVDYDLNCPAALAKAGHRPVDEGLVSLTPQDQLDFVPKKGSLKRIRIKKYFATMGAGIKEVFVPPGEVDDEAELEGTEVSAAFGTAQPQQPQTGPTAPPRPSAPAPAPPGPAPVSPGVSRQMERKVQFEELEFKRRQLLARVQELQSAAASESLASLKKQALEKAAVLGQENRFEEAGHLLDQLAARLSNATPAPGPAPAPPGPATPPISKQMQQKLEFEENQFKRREMTKRIEELSARPLPPERDAARKQAIQRAQGLAEAKNFAEANGILDQFLTSLKTLPSRPPPPSNPPAAPPVPREIKLSTYLSGRANLRKARESAAAELQRLHAQILADAKGEPFYDEIEAKSQKLFEYLAPVDESLANKLDDAGKCPDLELQAELNKQVRALIQKQLAALQTHPLAPFIQKNPFGTFIIRQPLEVTLLALDKQLS